MRPLLRLLLENPVLLFIVLAWIAGAIGSALQKAKRAAEQRRRQQAPPSRPRPHAEPRPRSAQEVADEMREILGMEPEQRRSRGRAATGQGAPPVEVVVRDPDTGDRRVPREAPPPLPRAERRSGDARIPVGSAPPGRSAIGSDARGGRLSQVDSHVGEQMQARSTPVSGQVAGPALGTLGGRSPSGAPRRRGSTSRFVDLSDLGKLIVAREILDPPLALR